MDLKKLKQDFLQDLEKCKDLKLLEEIDIKYFSRKQGLITELLKGIKDLSVEEKKTFGGELNMIKTELEELFNAKKNELEEKSESTSDFDYTLEKEFSWQGSRHPFNIVQKEIVDILVRMGYSVSDSSEIDRSHHNFDMLNFPADHPSRETMDTFYIGGGTDYLLRTHTSSMQNRILSREKTSMPIRVVLPGKVFRNEKIDATHDVFFYQTEAIFVGENVNIGNLIWTLKTFLKELFGKEMKIRMRPNFFPFVEPGMEIDMWYEDEDTGKGKWIEMLGAGMIHRNVLANAGIDPDVYSGFAFGLGSRFTMLKYKLSDFRAFMSNDIRFLNQFR